MTAGLRSHFVWPLTGLFLAALAGCADGTAKPAPSAESSTQTATSQSSSTANPSAGRVSLTNCATPDNGRVYFQFQDTVVSLAPTEIQETIPKGLKRPFTAESVKAALEQQTAQGAGCPEKPIELLVLSMSVPAEGTKLNGQIGLIAGSSGQFSAEFAGFLTKLQNQPPKSCQATQGDLLICPATQKIGNRDVEIAYIVTTDRSRKLRSGAPLAIRCERQADKIGSCRLLDLDSNGVTFEAMLESGPYTTASLDAAWQLAQRSIETRRR
ncbi:MAG: hypothetical protein AAF479_02950 [Pseudomonadota bacterium]